jgi:predicted 2-oxoglutarate/Fe(II)-dependent dioxygenase YbiX
VPKAEIFRRLGLFAVEGFADAGLCRRIRGELRSAVQEAATVRTAGGSFAVDESVRSVKWVTPPESTTALVQARLMDVKPAVEAHFGLPLADCQAPQFLAYGPGDFYRAHRDNSADRDAPAVSQERRVSAVLFLNATAAEPGDDCYGGGALTFYGLMDDPRMKSVGLPLEADEGLLMAFRADTVHGVAPVTHGFRYTAVSWFR